MFEAIRSSETLVLLLVTANVLLDHDVGGDTFL
jgi:hypothetical protein